MIKQTFMKKIVIALTLSALVVSCINKEDEMSCEKEHISGVVARVSDFSVESAQDTKTILTQEGSNAPTFAWRAGDVIGVVPMDGVTFQSNYVINEIGENPRHASFDGGEWALKEGMSYSSYYPYREGIFTSDDKISFSFEGQTQNGNNNLTHIGDYDFMYANTTSATGGHATFDFKHLISLTRLELMLPAGRYNRVELSSNCDWFANAGILSLSDGHFESEESVPTMVIELNNCELQENGILAVWFAMAPTDILAGRTVKIQVDSDTFTYSGQIDVPCTLVAGKAYSFSCSEFSFEESHVISATIEYTAIKLKLLQSTNASETQVRVTMNGTTGTPRRWNTSGYVSTSYTRLSPNTTYLFNIDYLDDNNKIRYTKNVYIKTKTTDLSYLLVYGNSGDIKYIPLQTAEERIDFHGEAASQVNWFYEKVLLFRGGDKNYYFYFWIDSPYYMGYPIPSFWDMGTYSVECGEVPYYETGAIYYHNGVTGVTSGTLTKSSTSQWKSVYHFEGVTEYKNLGDNYYLLHFVEKF